MKETKKKKKEEETKKKEEQRKKEEAKKKKEQTKKGKEKMEVEDEEEEEEHVIPFKSLRAKTTVQPFYDATHSLSPERRKMVMAMGFGTMIDFPLQKIPGKLPYFILTHMDMKKMQINLPNGGVIKIKPKTIREVLGIPMGPRTLCSGPERDSDDVFVKQFMAQFPERKRITTTALSKVIQSTEETDFTFQMNFLMLFANCLGTCYNSSMLKYHVLQFLKTPEEIPTIDWCTYIWNCMKLSNEGWDDSTMENWYYGPHAAFTLIYLHFTKFDLMDVSRKWPAIRNWNTKLIEKRQDMEMEIGGFGHVMVIEEEDESEEGDIRKQKEQLYEAVEEKFERVLNEKKELENFIRVSMEIYPGDETIRLYVEKYNTQFQGNLQIDENGRVIDNQEGTSIRDGGDDEGRNTEEGGDDESDDESDDSDPFFLSNEDDDDIEGGNGEEGNNDKEKTTKETPAETDKQQAEEETIAKKKQAEKEAAEKEAQKKAAEKKTESEKKKIEEAEKAAKEAASKEAAEKEAAAKEAAEKEAAAKEAAAKEAAEKEAAAKEAAEKEAAAKEAAAKEAAEKEAAAKEAAKKEAAAKEAAAKEAAEKEAANKKQEAEKEAAAKKAAKIEAENKRKSEEATKQAQEKEAEKKRKLAVKELANKRVKQKVKRLSDIPI